MSWQDFSRFDKMIAPTIIRWVFLIGLALIILGGLISFLGLIITSITQNEAVPLLIGLFLVPIGTALTLLTWRIYCEIIIVIFSINESLTDIKKLLAREQMQ